MATSTLVQFLGDGVTTPSGIGADSSNRRQVETFIAGGAIASGDWVSLDVSKTGASANVVTGTGVGQALTPNGTAGRVGPAEYVGNGSGAAAIRIPTVCGTCLTVASGNTAEVMVKKQF